MEDTLRECLCRQYEGRNADKGGRTSCIEEVERQNGIVLVADSRGLWDAVYANLGM